MVHGILPLFYTKLLKLSECLQFSNCLVLYHSMTSPRHFFNLHYSKFEIWGLNSSLAYLKYFISLSVNIGNRKTAFNHKGNKSQMQWVKKIKTQECKKSAKILKNTQQCFLIGNFISIIQTLTIFSNMFIITKCPQTRFLFEETRNFTGKQEY